MTLTPYVVGVDLSMTAAGLCIISPNGTAIEVSTVGTKMDDRSFGGFADRMDQLAKAIASAVPAASRSNIIWGIEGLSFGSKSSELDRIHASWWMVGERLVREYGWPEPYIISPNQRAMYGTGKGTSAKQAVLLATVRRYPGIPIADDNQADATLIAHMVRRIIGLPMDDLPATHTRAVDTVTVH